MRQVAALPLVAITVWEGLVDQAKVCADQTVPATQEWAALVTLQSS